MPRANVYVRPIHETRFREAVRRSGMPLSNLVEAMVLCLIPQEIQGLCACYTELRRHEASALEELRGALIADIQKLHMDELLALRDHARHAEPVA